MAYPGNFTGSVWTVTDGYIATTSATPLTIPDYPIGNSLLTVSLTVGLGLGILASDPIKISDPTGLNTMTGYVTSYSQSTGALVCQIGPSFQFEIRHVGPHADGYSGNGYSAQYLIGTYPNCGPILTAALGTGVSIIDVGRLQVLLPESLTRQLHNRSYLASMTMADGAPNTRQLFIGQLPVQYGGVTI